MRIALLIVLLYGCSSSPNFKAPEKKIEKAEEKIIKIKKLIISGDTKKALTELSKIREYLDGIKFDNEHNKNACEFMDSERKKYRNKYYAQTTLLWALFIGFIIFIVAKIYLKFNPLIPKT